MNAIMEENVRLDEVRIAITNHTRESAGEMKR